MPLGRGVVGLEHVERDAVGFGCDRLFERLAEFVPVALGRRHADLVQKVGRADGEPFRPVGRIRLGQVAVVLDRFAGPAVAGPADRAAFTCQSATSGSRRPADSYASAAWSSKRRSE